MKKLLALFSISSLILSGCNSKEDKYKNLIKPGKANIILITGQSNASGNSPSMYLEKKSSYIYSKFENGVDNVLTSFWVHNNRFNDYFEPTKFGMADGNFLFGPEIGIADVFSEANGYTYIIKFAAGGTRLDDEWLNSKSERGRLYNDSINWFKNKMNYLKSLGAEPNIIGQFWMQGEGDSMDPYVNKYKDNMINLINFYRSDLSEYYTDSYPFVDAYISTKTLWPKPHEINTAKQAVADTEKDVFCIKTNGEDENAIDLDLKSNQNEGDDFAHYDCQSEVLLGQTVGKIIKDFMSK